jgi:hypothetical protein
MIVRWCNIITPNVPAASEEKSDGSNDGFSDEVEQIFNDF